MSDDVELPRGQVVDYLEKFDPQVSVRYIEYLIQEKQEDDAVFHDRLAELYLGIAVNAKKRGDEGTFQFSRSTWSIHIFTLERREEVYSKLLHFIDTTNHYHPARLYGRLSEGQRDSIRGVAFLLTTVARFVRGAGNIVRPYGETRTCA